MLAGLLAICTATNLVGLNQYLSQFVRVGAVGGWTDAIFPLADYLWRNANGPVFASDWGMVDALVFLHEGKRVYGTAEEVLTAGPNDERARKILTWMLAQPGVLFVSHTPKNEFNEGNAERLRAVMRTMGYGGETEAVINDSNGRPIFEVIRFRSLTSAPATLIKLRTSDPRIALPTQIDERTALILSAGGVFGAYQAGVWSAICDSFTPDVIVGASIGSVNGWLIASRCPPEDIERFWLEAGELMRLRPRVPRRWCHGVFDFARVQARFKELCDAYRPAIPLYVALTQVRGLRPTLASGPSLGCAHLMASCAVPAAFDLQRIDGILYADGGLLAALPMWAVPQVGAARVVAVNAMPPAPFRRRGEITAPNTVLIQPDPPLGSYFAMLRYRRENIAGWIETGRRDGSRIKHSIRKCFARQ